MQGAGSRNQLPELLTNVATTHPDEYTCALRIKLLLETRLGMPSNDDESLFLTLHFATRPIAPASAPCVGPARATRAGPRSPR